MPTSVTFVAQGAPASQPPPKPSASQPPLKPSASVDVLVWGATPAGMAAATAAASSGASVWLLSDQSSPGGLITHAWLTVLDMNRSRRGLLTRGAFSAFFRAVGQRDGVSLPLAQAYFDRLAMHTPHLTSHFSAHLLAAQRSSAAVTQVKVRLGNKDMWIAAKRFIDASDTAALAAAAGAPTFYGHQDVSGEKTTPAATLIFRLKGVNWQQVVRFTGRRHGGGTAWGYGAIDFKDHQLPPGMTLRGMNLSLQPDGTVLVNALWVHGVNPLDAAGMKARYQAAKAALPAVVHYLAANAPGFSHATLAGAAPEFYIRQSRQIYANTQLTAVDELQNRCFPDRVAMGNYPVDIQGAEGDPRGLALFRPSAYTIPFASLIPKGLANLLVVGQAAGYSSIAQGSARVIPIGMAEGQAAGLAAALSLARSVSFPQLDRGPAMAALQKDIVASGGYLTCFAPASVVSHSWVWPYFKQPLNHMMVAGGYSNDFHLQGRMSQMDFSNWLLSEPQLLSAAGKKRYHAIAWTSSHRLIDVQQACDWVLAAAGYPPSGGCAAASGRGLIGRHALVHLSGQTLTRAQGLLLISSLASALNGQGTQGRQRAALAVKHPAQAGMKRPQGT